MNCNLSFCTQVSLGIPCEKSREQILKVLCSKISLSEDIDLATVARLTPGFVGADLLSLIREAAMVAITRVFEDIERQRGERKKRKMNTHQDEGPAKKKPELVVNGKQQKSVEIIVMVSFGLVNLSFVSVYLKSQTKINFPFLC